MNKSEQIDKIAAALHSAQERFRGAKKDSNNPFFKSKYADLESVWEACRDGLRDHGLSVSQFPVSDGDMVGVETILMHISGQYISNTIYVRPVKQDPQAAGSAITYLRRYALAGVLGIIQTDDDANESSGKVYPKVQAAPQVSGTKVAEEIKESLKSTEPYVATIGKHKGKLLTSLNKDELRQHETEILDWLGSNRNMSKQNQKLAEELLDEIKKVL